MLKRILPLILIMLFVISTTGCSGSWRRKFVRKSKSQDIDSPVLQPYNYEKEFTNNQFYANHYVFWKNAESELISLINAKGNFKRIKSRADYAVVELKKLYELLFIQKQKELAPYIQELVDMVKRINEPNYINTHSNVLSSELSKHYRAVNRDFSYYSVKKFIKADEVKEETDEPATK